MVADIRCGSQPGTAARAAKMCSSIAGRRVTLARGPIRWRQYPMAASQMPTRAELQRALAKAAQARSGLSMLAWVFLFPALIPLRFAVSALWGDDAAGIAYLIAWLTGALLISWKLTRQLCIPAVLCPMCGASLWACGTRNFKPRRLKVRKDVCGCLECGARFSGEPSDSSWPKRTEFRRGMTLEDRQTQTDGAS